ncbi:hypothetical protein ACWDRR_27350 [Kitasatospora sp. NPDC003701]
MTAPATNASHLDRLHRAGQDSELAAVLDSAEEGLLAPLHQFLEHAAEVFRQRGDLRSADALDAHKATIEEVGNELHYLAEDLAAPPRTGRAAAATSTTVRAAAAAASEPAPTSTPPPRPVRTR